MSLVLSPYLAEKMEVYAHRPQTLLTVRQLFEFGSSDSPTVLLQASQFLHREFSIRLARMAKTLETLPYGLSEMPSVQNVLDLYMLSFRDIQEFDHPRDLTGEEAFTELIEKIKRRHLNVVRLVANGVLELKERYPEETGEADFSGVLNRFYTARIGIRMLIGQHIALHEHRKGWAGIIQREASPANVARAACHQATTICRQTYGEAPDVEIVGKTDLSFTYIPSHLFYMLFELLKNSLRATVEFHGEDADFPPVKVIIAGGEEDVAIKIADEGGGIPRSGMPRIWTYLYTTGRPPERDESNPHLEVDHMAGYGFGLPLARLYSRYFGGDLQISSMEGYGADALLHLSLLGNQEEALP